MNIDTATARIEADLKNLERAIGEPVFDEWAIIEKTSEGWKLVEYRGDRHEEFVAGFVRDMAALKETLDPSNIQIGDFAFSHEGYGSGFDAHICAGKNKLVIFNNTKKNTDEITANPKWTSAQVHFNNLLEAFIADPIA
ncbi:hypothetical protein EGM51_09005 [Verrucomicrobia bacterium S94]|nr:hypothetical protein EGM51_09005 [Verrucomicrobia bacterium S94]